MPWPFWSEKDVTLTNRTRGKPSQLEEAGKKCPERGNSWITGWYRRCRSDAQTIPKRRRRQSAFHHGRTAPFGRHAPVKSNLNRWSQQHTYDGGVCRRQMRDKAQAASSWRDSAPSWMTPTPSTSTPPAGNRQIYEYFIYEYSQSWGRVAQ